MLRKFLIVFVISLLHIKAFAITVDELNINRYVNDYANIIDDTVENQLNQELYNFAASTTNQIVVVTVPNMSGDYIEHYSINLADKIKAGDAKYDNGVILLISKEEKELRIEVGYGLEATLTDGKSRNIIDNIIVPEFKKNNYTSGIYKGAHEIINIVSGNDMIKLGGKKYSIDSIIMIVLLLPFLSIFLIIFGLATKKGLPRIVTMVIFSATFFGAFTFTLLGIIGYIGFIIWSLLLGIIIRDKAVLKTTGSGGGRGFGGGGFGSSSGGGFSGGGGGFGGGGSSGRW